MSSALYVKITELAITVGELRAERDALKEQVKLLQEQNLRLTEALSKSQPPFPAPTVPAGYTPKSCSVCGMNFNGPMGYVCPRSDCPSRVTCTGILNEFT